MYDGPPASQQAQIGAVPLGRRCLSEEVANAVLLLNSDEASCISGTELVVDSGFTARQLRYKHQRELRTPPSVAV